MNPEPMSVFHVEQSLDQALQTLGLPLDPSVQKRLLGYLNKVLEVNQVMNLTAITDPLEAVHKHLVDSLSVLMLTSLQDQRKRASVWTDIGSGAGFPGLVLALAEPQALLHLIESTRKKAHFLETTIAEWGLRTRVWIHNERAEALSSPLVPRGTAAQGKHPSLRGSSDAVFFRGVARLASLVELGAPFLKLHGLLIAYKGPKAQDELAEAQTAMQTLHLTLKETRSFVLPGTEEQRTLVCLEKVKETSKNFPRMIGAAQKEPLGASTVPRGTPSS